MQIDLNQVLGFASGPVGLIIGWAVNRKMTATSIDKLKSEIETAKVAATAAANKSNVESQTTLSKEALQLIESQNIRIDKLESRIDSLNSQVLELHKENSSLKTELRLRTEFTKSLA